MSQPPYRPLRVMLGFLSLVFAIGGVLLIVSSVSSDMRSKVYSAVSSATQFFEASVGFGVMDFTQTMDSAPFTVGTHGLDIRRFSKPAAQREELTKWVADIFSKPDEP